MIETLAQELARLMAQRAIVKAQNTVICDAPKLTRKYTCRDSRKF